MRLCLASTYSYRHCLGNLEIVTNGAGARDVTLEVLSSSAYLQICLSPPHDFHDSVGGIAWRDGACFS